MDINLKSSNNHCYDLSSTNKMLSFYYRLKGDIRWFLKLSLNTLISYIVNIVIETVVTSEGRIYKTYRHNYLFCVPLLKDMRMHDDHASQFVQDDR